MNGARRARASTRLGTPISPIAKASSGKFVLHTGGTDYQLDDQAKAGKFEGKDVKVTGQLDQSSNTIKVQAIEPSSSM